MMQLFAASRAALFLSALVILLNSLQSQRLLPILMALLSLARLHPHCDPDVPDSYTFIILPAEEQEQGPILIYIASLPHEFSLRSAARQTWIQDLPDGTPVIFIVGRPTQRSLQFILLLEAFLYADILQVNLCETLETEILKTHAMLSHKVFFRRDFDLVLTARAQTLILPSGIEFFSRRGNASFDDIWCLFSRHSVQSKDGGSGGGGDGEWGGCSGHVYVLGGGAGERVWSEAARWPRHSGEDVFFTGIVPTQLNLPRLHSSALIARSVSEVGELGCLESGVVAVTSVEGAAQMRATWTLLHQALPCPILSPR